MSYPVCHLFLDGNWTGISQYVTFCTPRFQAGPKGMSGEGVSEKGRKERMIFVRRSCNNVRKTLCFSHIMERSTKKNCPGSQHPEAIQDIIAYGHNSI